MTKEYKIQQKKNRTKEGLIRMAYRNQRSNSKSRGMDMPTYTVDELIEWFNKQDDKYDMLYNKWVESGYSKALKPSIDRIDNDKGYSFDNIRLMDWKENQYLGNIKTVHQYDLDNNLIATYPSMLKASIETNIDKTAISNCANNRLAKAGGYIWSKILI